MSKNQQGLSDEIKAPIENIFFTTLEEVSKCFWEDTPYIVKIANDIIRLPHFIQQEIFWNKFYKYVIGIKTDSEFSVKFATKIANADDRREYASRIISIIDKIEEMQKIDFIINATRAFCWDRITRNEFFRICHTVEKVYIDDLDFLMKNYNPQKYFVEDINAVGLTSYGLMRKAVIDGGSWDEDDDGVAETHVFTELAKLVYDNALMYDKREEL